MTGISDERLDTLVIARLATAGKSRRPSEILEPLRRFSPRELTEGQWRQVLADALEGLRARGIADAELRVPAGELARRIGGSPRKWQQLAEKVLPALALGIDGGDAKALKRLDGRDAWAAAIAARALGLWRSGPPPSLSTMCNGLVWQALGLPGAPKQCPPELQAHFVRERVGGDAGPRERMVRLLAAQEAGAPRAELRALLEGLVRMWLSGREVGASMAARHGEGSHAGVASAPAAVAAADLIADARAAAAVAREGVFGERKVFISAVWQALRAMPAWASLELDELKARLMAAHRDGELVLARADLVSAMDPALVAASEIRTNSATFHFIVREPRT